LGWEQGVLAVAVLLLGGRGAVEEGRGVSFWISEVVGQQGG
jgi:hypothetical protein